MKGDGGGEVNGGQKPVYRDRRGRDEMAGDVLC
jgi:hypothetical protein